MKNAPMLLIPFKEVIHNQPDDCLHFEPVQVRGHAMEWTIPAHRHEGLHQFQWLASGRVEGTIDGQHFEAQGPLLMLVAPGSVHGFVYTRDAVGQQVTLPTRTLQQLLSEASLVDNALGASAVMTALSSAEAADCQDLFDRIGVEFTQARPGRVQALMACATLLALFCARHHNTHIQPVRAQGLRDTLVQRYLALVDRHYRSHRPLGFYAQQLSVTVDHLSRSCRSVRHASALEILQDRLMLEARRLLAYTQMPVAAVATELGFDDPAYFTRSFQRTQGHSPTRYRSLLAQGVRELQRAR